MEELEDGYYWACFEWEHPSILEKCGTNWYKTGVEYAVQKYFKFTILGKVSTTIETI